MKLGIGAQLPKSIRDARKSLYPAMEKAKDEGKNVKFVGKRCSLRVMSMYPRSSTLGAS